jgi:nucleoside-diphosphate-sugar epimerase
VPVTEDEPPTAYGEYGTGKAAIEALLHRETIAGGVPSVVLHPGHISGPGSPVIPPAGNLDPDVWRRLATGEPLVLPGVGLGVLHHGHADDIPQPFERALTRPAAGRASTGPATPWGTHRGTARWTPCTSRFAGSRQTAMSTSAARTSRPGVRMIRCSAHRRRRRHDHP